MVVLYFFPPTLHNSLHICHGCALLAFARELDMCAICRNLRVPIRQPTPLYRSGLGVLSLYDHDHVNNGNSRRVSVVCLPNVLRDAPTKELRKLLT